MPLIEYIEPERFVAGTVGPAGQRTFFLQATDGARVTSVSLEKAQVAMLAERIAEVLDGLELIEDTVPAPEDNEPLTTPIDDEFRVATLTLAWDHTRQLVVVECIDSQLSVEVGEDGEAAVEGVEDDTVTFRVAFDASSALEFCRRSVALVDAGRPPCPLCAEPLDPSGHICPRANGYRR